MQSYAGTPPSPCVSIDDTVPYSEYYDRTADGRLSVTQWQAETSNPLATGAGDPAPSFSCRPQFVDQSAHYDQIIEVDQRTLCKAERNPNTEVTVYPCRWDTHGGACQRWIEGDEREILTHLRKYHDVQGQTKDPILCKWSGCSEELKNGSIPRHIMTHVKVALRCSKCRMKFPRKDRIQNHRRMVEECANANIETVPGPEARLIRIEP
ncbi:hypothetical protein EDD16DRAFT_1605377 [Pisolithus croceorrhizus]|nr:hypothetical protein EDD16DRAFT_1605377 [Pisolithus croceorrhizus]KAI6116038.1 hypothetical protein F5141DRAFT_642714 [Pisolithus sp. B1]